MIDRYQGWGGGGAAALSYGIYTYPTQRIYEAFGEFISQAHTKYVQQYNTGTSHRDHKLPSSIDLHGVILFFYAYSPFHTVSFNASRMSLQRVARRLPSNISILCSYRYDNQKSKPLVVSFGRIPVDPPRQLRERS